jgi:hypothetical protein
LWSVLVVGVIVLAVWLLSRNIADASTIREVQSRAWVLHSYLQNRLRADPGLARRVEPGSLQAQIEYLEEQQRNHWQWEAEQERAAQHWQELWVGLSEPLPFDLAEGILAKLDLLEQTRLREAVQAYRVRAWTPAAAVCGMLLEGRLQRLCQEHGLETGGMRDMIERLGAANLLGRHHREMAQVGEFFRHRAAHPSSEVFDQEKTTLILTLLLLLVRDVF